MGEKKWIKEKKRKTTLIFKDINTNIKSGSIGRNFQAQARRGPGKGETRGTQRQPLPWRLFRLEENQTTTRRPGLPGSKKKNSGTAWPTTTKGREARWGKGKKKKEGSRIERLSVQGNRLSQKTWEKKTQITLQRRKWRVLLNRRKQQ